MDLFDSLLAEAICSESLDTSYDNCPISGLPMIEPITLMCGHTFEIYSMYREVYRQKKNPAKTEVQRLRINEIKCPLCRNVQNKLLPPCTSCPRVYGVNFPIKFCMFPCKCCHMMHSGKRKGELCGRPCFGERCKRHSCIIEMSTCQHILIRGPRKGEMCSKRCKNGTYCSTHKKHHIEELNASVVQQ